MSKLVLTMVALAGLGISLGLAEGNLWPEMAIAAIICLLWMVGHWRGATWTAALGLLGLGGLAGYGILQGAAVMWLLPGTILALAAWDLDHFYRLRQTIDDIRAEADLVRSHTQRLGLVVGLSLVMAVAALLIRLNLNLLVAIALGFLLIFGFSRAVAFVRRESD